MKSRHQIKEFVLNFIKCEMQANRNFIKAAKTSFRSALCKGSLLSILKRYVTDRLLELLLVQIAALNVLS